MTGRIKRDNNSMKMPSSFHTDVEKTVKKTTKGVKTTTSTNKKKASTAPKTPPKKTKKLHLTAAQLGLDKELCEYDRCELNDAIARWKDERAKDNQQTKETTKTTRAPQQARARTESQETPSGHNNDSSTTFAMEESEGDTSGIGDALITTNVPQQQRKEEVSTTSRSKKTNSSKKSSSSAKGNEKKGKKVDGEKKEEEHLQQHQHSERTTRTAKTTSNTTNKSRLNETQRNAPLVEEVNATTERRQSRVTNPLLVSLEEGEMIASTTDGGEPTIYRSHKPKKGGGCGLAMRLLVGQLLTNCFRIRGRGGKNDEYDFDWHDDEEVISFDSSLPELVEFDHVEYRKSQCMKSIISDISDHKKHIQRRQLQSIGCTNEMISKMQEMGLVLTDEEKHE